MKKVANVDDLEAVVGTRPQTVLMKAIDALDDGCRVILANTPIAGLGFRDADGFPHTTLVGGAMGFTRVDSPTRVSLDFPADRPGPVEGGGVSMVFLLPGIGETLRVTGSVADRSATSVAIDLEEAFTHCAKCILRSGLWTDARPEGADSPVRQDKAAGPLAAPAVTEFLSASPFVIVSSWDGGGSSDTSPKGDGPGFVQIIDSRTLAIPDRKGNRRTDTFHNLLECDQLSIAAIVPKRDDVLHMGGTAFVTDDPTLLLTMAVGEKPPKAALIVRVERAEIATNEAVRSSRMWDTSAHVDPSAVPDLMQLGAEHLAHNKARGVKASMTRVLSRGLAASPKFLRRGVDLGYRRELKHEGYDNDRADERNSTLG